VSNARPDAAISRGAPSGRRGLPEHSNAPLEPQAHTVEELRSVWQREKLQ